MTEKPVCACCGGEGRVLSILNEVRPCSRCDGSAFDSWAKERAARREERIDYRPLGGEEKR